MGPGDIRMFGQGDPNDTRFQFEVIKGLSESIRQMAEQMSHMQRTQVTMLERLATLEANKVGEVVKKLETTVHELEAKVDDLNRDRDRRDGALGMLGGLRVWGPVIFSLFTAMYLLGRAMGLISSPPMTVTKVETPLHVEPRRDQPPVMEAGNVH